MKVRPLNERRSKEEQKLHNQKQQDYYTRMTAIFLVGASVYYFFIKLLFL